MFKICIWMDVPSHYQSAFFKAVNEREDVDLQVCYTKGVSERRAAQGWRNDHVYQAYEQCAKGLITPVERLSIVPEWEQRIHIISSYICRDLIAYFCENNVPWCHWSEAPGVRLAETVGYNMDLFRLLNPLMLKLKRKDGLSMRKHALAVLGQGDMAGRAFQTMGVSKERIFNLFYVPEALPEMEPSEAVREFAKGRRVFVAVGALCKRKGVDLLLKAFSKLNTDEWCVVFCGMDQSNKKYQSLARSLKIEKSVLFLGAYPIDRISEVYGASDVFVLASRFDGWGAVFNEAASLGMPIVGTDLCGGSWHLIEDGVNGYRIRSGSVRALSRALKNCVEHVDRLPAFGQKSKEIFLKDLTPAANAARLVDALKKIDGIRA